MGLRVPGFRWAPWRRWVLGDLVLTRGAALGVVEIFSAEQTGREWVMWAAKIRRGGCGVYRMEIEGGRSMHFYRLKTACSLPIISGS
jgi:hypothetical protein